jgi:hypothetical protein
MPTGCIVSITSKWKPVAMASIRRAHAASIFLIIAGLVLSGCNDGGNSTSTTGGASPNGVPATSNIQAGVVLAISGNPAQTAAAGSAYSFRPAVKYTGKNNLTISIDNFPKWATFDATNGTLSGTPGAGDIGVFAQVSIHVSDGVVTAALAPFSITVIAAAANAGVLTITGEPAATVVADAVYNFRPVVSATVGALMFTVKNKPSWATFDQSTGALSGKPTAGDVGTYAQIGIGVSDTTASAELATFSVSVVSPQAPVTLSWTPPSQNTNGTAATDLAGYHIYYGSKSTALYQVVTVASANKTTYAIANLPSGTWYFAVAAYNAENVESELSVIVPVVM